MNSVFLVQGVFFQKGVSFGLSEKEGVGLAVQTKEALYYTVFMGIIFKDPESKNLIGTMNDYFGYSELSEVTITEKEFSYNKKYLNRRDSISYYFQKEGDKWVGGYQGEATGSGKSNCLLTEVDYSFFLPKI